MTENDIYIPGMGGGLPPPIAFDEKRASTSTATTLPQQGVPMGTPTAPHSTHVPMTTSKTTLNDSQYRQLKEQGYTKGLCDALAENCNTFALRIWVVDNSGSMNSTDGQRLIPMKNVGEVKSVPCTRWKEIVETVDYHVQLAALLQAPTQFRLLNPPQVSGLAQDFSVAERGSAFIREDVQIAHDIMTKSSPIGVTPLTEHIYNIQQQVEFMKNDLVASGKRVAIILATDGLPSDNRGVSDHRELDRFISSLRSLEGLPVWLVVRLCTDHEATVNFYNNLDKQLEMSVEVLDNFTGEAKEMYETNPWINYTLPIHRMREMGFQNRLFDLLDERALTISEVRDYCMLVFGTGVFDGVPEPEVDLAGFLKAIDAIAQQEQSWHVIKRKMKPLVSVKKIHQIYGNGSCAIM